MADDDKDTKAAVAAPEDEDQRERDDAAAARIGLPHYSPTELSAKNAELRSLPLVEPPEAAAGALPMAERDAPTSLIAPPSSVTSRNAPAVSVIAPSTSMSPGARSASAAPTGAPTATTPSIVGPPPGSRPANAPTLMSPSDAVDFAQGQSPEETLGKPLPGGGYLLPTAHAVGAPSNSGANFHPAVPAIAGMFTREKNIGNPFLRVLARIGTGILSGVDAVGESAFPSVAMMVPGSTLNTEVRNKRAQTQANTEAQRVIEQENADTARIAATAKENAPAKPLTLSEAQGQTFQNLLGQTNPATNKPYTPQEALQEVQRQPAAAKETPHYTTDPGTGDVIAVAPDGKGGYTTTVAYKGNPKVETEIRQRPTAGGGVEDVLYNKQTGEVIKTLGPGVKAGAQAPLMGDRTKSGTAYLATLPDMERSLVQEIGSGKMPLGRLSYVATRNPQLLEEVAQAYPDFDASKVEGYAKTVNDFTSGKVSQALVSGNTAIQHLEELAQLDTDKAYIPGTEANKKYTALANTVVSELANFYQEPKTNEAMQARAGALTGVNRNAGIKEQLGALLDRLDSYEQQWTNAAPSKAYESPMPGLSEASKKIIAKENPGWLEEHPTFTPRANQQRGSEPARPKGVPSNAVWNSGARQWQLPQAR